jgi:hypothetical protein
VAADIKAQAQAVKDSKKDSNNKKKEEKKEQAPQKAIDPRQFVIINPNIDNGKLNESRSQTQIDYLIRLGLGDQDHLTWYRKVFANPKMANNNPYLRKYVSEVLEELLDILFSDAQMYNRLRTILQEKFKEADRENKERKKDITEYEIDPKPESSSFIGTDALIKKYADMTPGQSFELIKKALKGNKNG